MKKGVFEKWATWFDGETDTTLKDNAIETEAELIMSVVNVLKKYYQGGNYDVSNKVLYLHVSDSILYTNLHDREKDFKEELMTKINDEVGLSFREIMLMSGKPTANFTTVKPNVYIQINSGFTTCTTAVITAVDGCGSLAGKSCLLDSQEIANLPDQRYNIGIGKNVQTANGGIRENHIAINDNANDPQFKNNKYVSRSHAHISFSNGHGFVLFVETNGTRMAGKRTHIYRREKKIELNNVMNPEPLLDGDVIVLSKSVKLLFKIVK